MRWGGPDEVTLKPPEPPAPRESPENEASLPDEEWRGSRRDVAATPGPAGRTEPVTAAPAGKTEPLEKDASVSKTEPVTAAPAGKTEPVDEDVSTRKTESIASAPAAKTEPVEKDTSSRTTEPVAKAVPAEKDGARGPDGGRGPGAPAPRRRNAPATPLPGRTPSAPWRRSSPPAPPNAASRPSAPDAGPQPPRPESTGSAPDTSARTPPWRTPGFDAGRGGATSGPTSPRPPHERDTVPDAKAPLSSAPAPRREDEPTSNPTPTAPTTPSEPDTVRTANPVDRDDQGGTEVIDRVSEERPTEEHSVPDRGAGSATEERPDERSRRGPVAAVLGAAAGAVTGVFAARSRRRSNASGPETSDDAGSSGAPAPLVDGRTSEPTSSAATVSEGQDSGTTTTPDRDASPSPSEHGGTRGTAAKAAGAGAAAAGAAAAVGAAAPGEEHQDPPAHPSSEKPTATTASSSTASPAAPAPSGPTTGPERSPSTPDRSTAREKKSGGAGAAAVGGAAAVAGAAAAGGRSSKAPERPDATTAPERSGAPGRYRNADSSTTDGSAAASTLAAPTATPADAPTEPEQAAPAPGVKGAAGTSSERTDVLPPVDEPRKAPKQSASARDRRRRRRVLFAFVLAALVLAAFLGLVALITDHAGGSPEPQGAAASGPALTAPAAPPAPPTPPPPPQLPRGGTTFFPQHRVVAYYGTAGTDALGILGEGSPEEAATRLEQAAVPFASPGKSVLPAMELIVGIANSTPGPDGTYHSDIDEGEARQYLAAARAKQQVMIIDVQPGRADFMTAVKPWENLLREPDVGLALDPEWRMGPGEVPGKVIGTVSADEVNQVSTWLADMVTRDNLPQKLFVLHQFTPDMITNPERLATPPQLAVVQHIDGFGAPANKIGKYQQLQRPQQLHLGFKLFIDEDTPTLTPEQALTLPPAPDLITYQ